MRSWRKVCGLGELKHHLTGQSDLLFSSLELEDYSMLERCTWCAFSKPLPPHFGCQGAICLTFSRKDALFSLAFASRMPCRQSAYNWHPGQAWIKPCHVITQDLGLLVLIQGLAARMDPKLQPLESSERAQVSSRSCHAAVFYDKGKGLGHCVMSKYDSIA